MRSADTRRGHPLTYTCSPTALRNPTYTLTLTFIQLIHHDKVNKRINPRPTARVEKSIFVLEVLKLIGELAMHWLGGMDATAVMVTISIYAS